MHHPANVAPIAVSLLLLGLLTSIVYWVGLSGPFIFDDYNNIIANPLIALDDRSVESVWRATLAGDAGPLKRPLSMLSFALNAMTTGLDPFHFKLTNLVIHLVNGWLVFLLTRRLLTVGAVVDPRARLALFVTALWLLHPMQLTSVLYVVQRMTSLSATFVLLGLLAYLAARSPEQTPTARLAWLWVGVPACTAFAALAKENGVLLLLFAFVLETTLLRYRHARDWRFGTPLQFTWLFVAMPLLALFVFLATTPEWLARGADTRPFNAGERLLTEARVLWLYVKLLFLPAISNLALFYDDFTISRGLLDPPDTVWAVAALVALAVSATALRNRAPWHAFGVLWFLAGHAMESSFILLELVHPHRNYLAYLGPMIALGVGGHAVLSRARGWLPAAAAVAVIAVLATTTGLRAYQWRNPLDLAAYEVRHRPGSSRAQYEMGRLLNIAAERGGQSELNEEAKKFLRRSAELNPYGISGLIGLAILAEKEIPADVHAELQSRLRRHSLAASDAVYLKALMSCQRTAKCATPPGQLLDVFGAALSQSRLRPRVRADVLTVLGAYYAQNLGDITASVRLLREAAQLVPDDASRQLNLAQALLFIPEYKEARAVIAHAEQLDKLGVNQLRLHNLRRDLERFERASRQSPPLP